MLVSLSQSLNHRCPRRPSAWWRCAFIYTGFQTSYFIGVIGTLTYADDARSSRHRWPSCL